jgi:ABC-type ATPase involved in cell division
MPKLVADGLNIRDVNARRIPFRRVRINQVFYADRRWYQRKSAQKAIRADTLDTETVHFKQTTVVRVFDEATPTLRRMNGMSFDEFINQAAHE